MFCKFCGASIDSDSVFCSQCGRKIVKTPRPIPEPQEIPSERVISYSPKMDGASVSTLPNATTTEPHIHIEPAEEQSNLPALSAGAVIIVFSIILTLMTSQSGFNEDARQAFLMIAAILRICVAIACGSIASSLNRNVFGWAVFGFILPGIALIVIGMQKKVK